MKNKIKVREYLESTYLKTDSESGLSKSENRKAVEDIINEAIKYRFVLVMLRSEHISLAKRLIEAHNSKTLIGTVIDFPLGDSSTNQKLQEAQESIYFGADDLDFVADYNAFKAELFDKFDNDIIQGTELALNNNKNVKWIIETGALSKMEIRKISVRINNLVDTEFKGNTKNIYIKTSTGYYGGFGATIEDIKTIKSSVNLKIKASGGVSTLSQVYKMINAGASRIGTSKALSIIKQI